MINKGWLHSEARRLFGKDHCEICNMSYKENKKKYHREFDMHNTLIPKNYSIMKKEAWMTLCQKCHLKLEFKKYDKMLTTLIERKEYERLLKAVKKEGKRIMSDIIRDGIKKECKLIEQNK